MQGLHELVLLVEWLVDEGVEVLAFEPPEGAWRDQVGYHEHLIGVFALEDTWIIKGSLIWDYLTDVGDLLD